MHMIRHDYPGMEAIPVPVKKTESILCDFSNIRIFQPLRTISLIQQEIDMPQVFHSAFFLRHHGDPVLNFRQHPAGQCISKTECHTLGYAATFKMWQPAFMPIWLLQHCHTSPL